MLKHLEACFGEKNLSPKTDEVTKMGEVKSIDKQIVKLKELELLGMEVGSQSSIDMILRSIINSYELRIKFKGKDVCSSSGSLSGVDSTMSPPCVIEIGSSSCSKLKGLEGN